MNSHSTPHTHPSPGSSGLSFGQILSGFWARKYFIFAFLVIVTASTYLIVSNLKPIYSSDAKVLIEGHDPDINRFSVNNQSSPADQMKVLSEAQVIQSEELTAGVIKKLKLNNFAEFNDDSKNDGKTASLTDTVRENFYDKLTVYPIAETRVVVVEFKSENAGRAAKIANALAASYVESTRRTPYDKNASTNSYLQKKIKGLKSEILSSEKRIEKFRARSGLIEGNEGTLYAQELAELNRKIAEVSAVRAEASAKAASARRLLGGDQSIDIAADVINSNLIQRLREEQIKLRRQITQMSTTYLPAHPQMVQLNNQLQNLDRLVAFEVTKIAASLTDQAKIAAARENTLKGKLNRLKTKAVGQGQNLAKLKSMVRDVEAKRTLLNNFLTKQADTASKTDLSNIPYGARIISRAVPAAKPAFPKTGPILFLSFISAFVLAFVVSFLRDVSMAGPIVRQNYQTAPHQASANQSYANTAMNVPGAMGAPPVTQNNLSAHQPGRASSDGISNFNLAITDNIDLSALYSPQSPLSAGLAQLATHAYQVLQSTGSKFILVTSEQNYPQKSFVSAGLASNFSSQGIRAVVVDADMLNPSISQLMAVQPGPGLSEVLTGAYPLSEAVLKNPATGVSVMPAGMRGRQAYGLLGTDSTSLVMRSLAMVYDVIIIHAPALSDHAAVQNFIKEAPYICLAGNSGWRDRQRLNNLSKQLMANGAGHISQVNCTAKEGGMLSGLFKSKAA